MSIKKFISAVLLSLGMTQSFAEDIPLDKVAVIVNDGVILESEIQSLLETVKMNAIKSGQGLPSEDIIRTQAIERLIVTNLQLQMAENMGMQISDAQLEQTIANMAQQDGITVEEIRRQLARDGISYEKYREEVRQELLVGEIRRGMVRRRIYITPQEVEGVLSQMEESGKAQTEFHLGHILINLPSQPSEEDVDSAEKRANKVLELLNKGTDFKKVAIASSSGSKALEGGDMGWMNINEMPTLFAEAMPGNKKGDFIGPIRSGAGFHILTIFDIRGQQTVEISEVKARHILVKPSLILSDQKAEEMLKDIRTKLLAGEVEFAAMAKEHSEDPGSALRGGDLGWADPNIYVAEFKATLGELEKDEISMPFRTVHGWHIAQLLDKRTEDATEKRKKDRAYQVIFNRKFNEEASNWLREIRDEAFIEIVED